uniref:ASCH domain-containing protein n=1 Tax=candidate division WWE3 bacterium TaxID=2053526 RepID=A0A831YPZ1_UNCKA
MLCCPDDPWCVKAEITKVRHCLLFEVTEEEWRADGFTSREELLEGMRHFYPHLTWESAVTVIYWDNVQGKLIDDLAELR